MRLKEVRKLKGLTQIEASEILNIPLRTYKRYELEEEKVDSFKYQVIYQKLMNLPAKTGLKSHKKYKIGIVGIGYVGLSFGALLSLKHDVIAFDINQERIDKVNSKQCYLKDFLLEKVFADKRFSLKAMCVKESSFDIFDFVIVSTNTDFNPDTGEFDTSSVMETIKLIRETNKKCLVVIKSTIPMGFTESLNDPNVIFSPEFLSECNAVHDILYPSRVIIGCNKLTQKTKEFAKILCDLSITNIEPIYMSLKEAEAVKLFSNAYLAMRVAYFNELDTYVETNDLKSSHVIKGVSLDPRIGDYYNNPSFGYGGYCLPKDTAQLEKSFLNIENSNIIKAIVESNVTRKEYIAKQIIEKLKELGKTKETGIIGVYRLAMKKNSDNWRNSSTLEIANILINKGYKVLIYEPNYQSDNCVDNIKTLFDRADIILANRMSEELKPVVNKVYTRDLTGMN